MRRSTSRPSASSPDYHTPSFGFDRWFQIDLARLQYLGFYLPAAALAKVFGPDAACRMVLSLMALALPGVVLDAARRFRPRPPPRSLRAAHLPHHAAVHGLLQLRRIGARRGGAGGADRAATARAYALSRSRDRRRRRALVVAASQRVGLRARLRGDACADLRVFRGAR